VPAEGKLEARVKGPNVTPGYWREPDLTRAAFDGEGYYRLGDALRFVEPGDPDRGFLFDGRIAEDFKLSTGTWVSVGPLRTQFLLHFAPYVRDVVIAGHDRDEVAALIFPDPDQWRRLESEGGGRETFTQLLQTLAIRSTGTSTRIERAIVLGEPPSFDAGELTDKGTINQRAVLLHRAALVERLYSPPFDADVILAQSAGPGERATITGVRSRK
jgi:feruloyl-CoA synthase